jgi:TolB-like protein
MLGSYRRAKSTQNTAAAESLCAAFYWQPIARVVIVRNSSFACKGKSIDIKQVGRELAVRYVLEGSVRKAGNRVRIAGRLIEAERGAHLRAERYNRPLDDIFALWSFWRPSTTSISSAVEN